MAVADDFSWSRPQWRALLVLSLVLATFVAAAGLSHLARGSGLLRDWPFQRDVMFELPSGTSDLAGRAPIGWLRVTEVRHGGEAERSGLRPGDLVRSTVMGVWPGSVLAPGVSWPVMVDRDGTRFTIVVVTPAQPPFPGSANLVFASQGVAGLVSAILGLFLVVRRGRFDRAATMLGMLLICLGWAVGGAGYIWAPSPFVVQVRVILSTVATAGIAYCLPMAALEISKARRAAGKRRIVHRVAALLAGVSVVVSLAGAVPVRLPAIAGNATWLFLAALLFLAIVLRNYRHNDAPGRNRIKIVLLACIAYSVSFGLFIWFNLSGQGPEQVWSIVASAVIGLAGPALIAYAVLRGKLFDFNFVLNRTLVYAAVSFVLLAAFGLAKWVIEHLIPESWNAGSEYYSVAIALVLFLILHRVHNGVERNIERFLFSPWHRNEEALRRFVTAAGHFDQTAVLCRTFAEELSRFAKGAGAALYLREAGGSYSLGCGTLAEAPARYEGDDLALALMRAERRPLRTAEMQSALSGVLALPMLDHGKLAGFALLDRKPDGTDYRPDEVEILGWAAHQVGLDLQAMRASELEAEVAGLNATVAALSAQLSAAGTRRRARARTGDAA